MSLFLLVYLYACLPACLLVVFVAVFSSVCVIQHPALSVNLSVGWLVGHILPFLWFLVFDTAPAQIRNVDRYWFCLPCSPLLFRKTWVAVYPTLFAVILTLRWNVFQALNYSGKDFDCRIDALISKIIWALCLLRWQSASIFWGVKIKKVINKVISIKQSFNKCSCQDSLVLAL